jgi:hypothetical protein
VITAKQAKKSADDRALKEAADRVAAWHDAIDGCLLRGHRRIDLGNLVYGLHLVPLHESELLRLVETYRITGGWLVYVQEKKSSWWWPWGRKTTVLEFAPLPEI